MRKRIYQIIELSKDNDKLSLIYDCFLLFVIILSIFPLTVKSAGTAGGFRLLKIFRLPRTFRVFRVFKLLRYSRSFARISMVFRVSSLFGIAVIALPSGIIRDFGKVDQVVGTL